MYNVFNGIVACSRAGKCIQNGAESRLKWLWTRLLELDGLLCYAEWPQKGKMSSEQQLFQEVRGQKGQSDWRR